MSGAVLSLLGTAGGGGSAVTITVSPQFIDAYNAGSASAAYQLNLNGKANQSINGGAYTLLENWCVPASEAGNYECYATLVSGVPDGGSAATGAWLALTSTRFWSVTRSTTGSSEVILDIGIRRVGDPTIIASGDITLYAEYF